MFTLFYISPPVTVFHTFCKIETLHILLLRKSSRQDYTHHNY